MSEFPRLHPDEIQPAYCLWIAGKNTVEIAIDLRGSKIFEPAVANSLADERERRWRAA